MFSTNDWIRVDLIQSNLSHCVVTLYIVQIFSQFDLVVHDPELDPESDPSLDPSVRFFGVDWQQGPYSIEKLSLEFGLKNSFRFHI